ncbi:MAG: sugar transferase [Sphingomonas sp.]|uniref:sugar transferase n=1 Tax=Sphingomonas sp. TaxID=28214 RepID=UPI001AC74DDB|nr:sugar transferase [Sphingomonas sp.]MBN8806896.1 sugar transferase [Sphingomonas sp.]
MQRYVHVPRATPFARIRVQLPLGLLLACFLPFFVRIAFGGEPASNVITLTLIVSIAGLILGYYFIRSMAVFPAIEVSFYVIPSFIASYLLCISFLIISRMDYSRSILFASFVIAVIFYIIIFGWLKRLGRKRIGVVPFGRTEELLDIAGIEWINLINPQDVYDSFDVLVADFHADIPKDWERVLADRSLQGGIIFHVKQLGESLTGRVQLEHLSENNFGSLVPLQPYVKLKVLLDFLVALAVLPVAIVVIGIVVVAVKLDSRGPAIFRQERIGYRGRPFTVYKIRSMIDSASESGSRRQSMTIQGDARITRVGRFIRRTRLDELPQIFNILRGEMSWIGPRPEALSLSEWYEAELPFYRYRHIVRPGLTGWAQVNQGHVAEIAEVREKLQNDFFYIKFFSPWLDMLIVLKTIAAVLTGFGAR